MGFNDFGDSGVEQSAADVAAQSVNAQNEAATETGHEKADLHREELAQSTNRPDRFGVGQSSNAAKVAAQNSDRAKSFLRTATAEAYNQTVTFNFGGRGMQMSLRDMSTVANSKFNHYANEARSLTGEAKTKAIQKRNAYGDLLRMTDLVASGQMSADRLNQHIQDHDLAGEIVDAAATDPDIVTVDTAPLEVESAQSGTYADQSLNTQTVGAFDAVFGSR